MISSVSIVPYKNAMDILHMNDVEMESRPLKMVCCSWSL